MRGLTTGRRVTGALPCRWVSNFLSVSKLNITARTLAMVLTIHRKQSERLTDFLLVLFVQCFQVHVVIQSHRDFHCSGLNKPSRYYYAAVIDGADWRWNRRFACDTRTETRARTARRASRGLVEAYYSVSTR